MVRLKAGENNSATLGRFSVPAAFLLRPHRRLRHEGPNQNEWDGRDHAGEQRVPPGSVAVGHRAQRAGKELGHPQGRQVRSVAVEEQIDSRDGHAAEGRERLGVAEHALALFRLRKQLRQPGDGRHELHAHADERQTAEDQKHAEAMSRTRRRRSRWRREGC